jgi:hypothetical protein
MYAAILPASVACNGMSDAGDPSSAPAAPPGEQAAVTLPLAASPGGAPQWDEAAILAEIGGVARIAPGDLELLSLVAVTWPDGCLGLAEPGQVCSQALVAGWLATVRMPDGTVREFRGGAGRVVAERR